MRNEIVFCMDSPGWPEFQDAKTPNLDKHTPERAFSFGTYTMPSIQAMLRGSMPIPVDRRNKRYRPYEEYCKSEHSIIPMTLSKKGYNTYLMTANLNISNTITKFEKDIVGYLPWFEHEYKNFDSGLTARKLIKHFLKVFEEPFYAFFLFIETHTPYMGVKPDDPRAQLREAQIEAIEHMDIMFKKLYKGIPKNTRIIVTSDHSDCWKDGVRFGHNPKHYRSMVKNDMIKDLIDVFIVEAYK